MSHHYSRYFSLAFLFSLWLLPTLSDAQTCNNGWIIGYTVTPSTCQSNGTVTAVLKGNTAGLSNVNYQLKQVGGPLTYGPSTSNVFTGVPAGKYTLEVSAYCSTDPSYYQTKSTPIDIGGTYKIPTIVLNSGRSRLSDETCPTGAISLDVQFGLKPYTFRILEAPAGETVPSEPAVTLRGPYFYDFDRRDYPAGHYKVEVEDACGYKINTEFDLNGGDLLFTPQPMASRFYPDLDAQRGLVPYGALLLCAGISCGNAAHDDGELVERRPLRSGACAHRTNAYELDGVGAHGQWCREFRPLSEAPAGLYREEFPRTLGAFQELSHTGEELRNDGSKSHLLLRNV